MAEGPENTIRVKVINLKCIPDTSNDDHMHLSSLDVPGSHFKLINFTLIVFSGPSAAVFDNI